MNAPAQQPQNIADVLHSDANDQVGALHRKWVSPVELVDAAIARAEAVNPQLNAIIHERYERARSEAAPLLRGLLPLHYTECPWS